ncbi:hypothetical protein Esti_005557 [Eimeria stiedai]
MRPASFRGKCTSSRRQLPAAVYTGTFHPSGCVSDAAQRYYDEVEKRKQLLPLPACGHRAANFRKPTKSFVTTKAFFQKRPTAPPPAAALLDKRADQTDDCNTSPSFENEDDLTVGEFNLCSFPQLPFSLCMFRWGRAGWVVPRLDKRGECRMDVLQEHCRTPSFQGSGVSDLGDRAELVEEVEGALLRAEGDISPRVKVDWNAADNRKFDRRENECHGAEAIVRGYVDLAHALLLHFEETLIAKQRLTQGSLQCAEILCHALQQIQDVNPRLAYLVERISIAVALLHKRKLADDKEAGLGPFFKETMFGQPHHQQSVGGLTRNARDEPPEYVKMLPSYVAVERHRSSSVSPAVQRCASCKCVTPVAPNVACQEPNDPAYCSRRSFRQSSDISKDELGDATAVHSRKDINRVLSKETPPQVLRAEREVEDDEAFTQPPPPHHGEHVRRSCPPAKHTPSRASSVALDTHKAPGSLAALVRGPEGPMKTHFVASQAAGEKASACQPPRAGGHRRLFGEREGEQAVRPLILSETLVLSDKSKNTSAREDDSYSVAVREALWLIKCATDFIRSGEGTEYVEKQFFRYFRSNDAGTVACEREIPEGMQASHGKYVLLRYAISVVEAEYGDSSRAADRHLYLPDLLRMRDILLRKEEGPRLGVREQRPGRKSEDEVASEAAKESHSLPERSPEQRMERHLPLTILNLPAASQRPAAYRGSGPLHVSRQAKSEMARVPSRPELVGAASSTEIVPSGHERIGSFKLNETNATPSPIELPSTNSNAASAPIKLPSTTSNAASAPIKLPSTASCALRSELMSRKSSKSSGTAGSLSPPVEDAPAQSPLSSPLQRSRASTVDPSPHQSIEVAARSSLLAGRSGSNLLEHSVSLRHDEELKSLGTSSSLALEKPFGSGERQGSKMSFAEQVASAAASQRPVLSPPADGLKLSVSSLRRDPATGTFNSRVFEAPSSPTEPLAIGLSASVGLMNLSASRSSRASLPDIPDAMLGSGGSQ